MNDSLLTKMMRVAYKVTGAERALAVNYDLETLDKINLEETTLEDPSFIGFAQKWLRHALDEGHYVITNNVVTDPTKAPTTNTNFANLRVVVCIPVRGHGGVYLDQHIRNGIIAREVINRLMDVIHGIQKNSQEEATEEHIMALYERMS